jgi:DNA-binding transcriptional MerR regulator
MRFLCIAVAAAADDERASSCQVGELRGGEPNLMTIGELASRTGLSRKLIREFEDRGLICSAGRSEAGYRLFDQSALWCVTVIGNLRSLGLTLTEIEQLAAVYLEQPSEPVGPHLGALLDRAEQRIQGGLEELRTLQERIAAFRAENAAVLAGADETRLLGDDPRRPSTRP